MSEEEMDENFKRLPFYVLQLTGSYLKGKDQIFFFLHINQRVRFLGMSIPNPCWELCSFSDRTLIVRNPTQSVYFLGLIKAQISRELAQIGYRFDIENSNLDFLDEIGYGLSNRGLRIGLFQAIKTIPSESIWKAFFAYFFII